MAAVLIRKGPPSARDAVKAFPVVRPWIRRIFVSLLVAGALLFSHDATPAESGSANSTPDSVASPSLTRQVQTGRSSDPGGLHQPDGLEGIAHRILALDGRITPVPDPLYHTLDDILDDACAAIAKLPERRDGRWDRRHAESVLRCIDGVLIARGFLYPNAGAVDRLADALTPFEMSNEQRRAFENHRHNRRRLGMIAERFPGPFHVLDCDTGSFIYLGVAGRLNLPLHLVTIPFHHRHPGHTFVRWREGPHSLNWETTEGTIRTDASYIQEWGVTPAEIESRSALVELSTDEVTGCAYHLLAIQHERHKDHETALHLVEVGLKLHPRNLDLLREHAWLTATAPGLRVRDHSAAIAHARSALRQIGDSDSHDTLAAVYASAGMFDLAIREQRAAIAQGADSRESLPAYKQRLELYLQNLPYRQAGPTVPVFGDSKAR